MARNQEYTTQILNRLRLVLDSEGFRKRGSHFVRDSDDVKQTISLQKSTRSTKDLVVAAVNHCVYSKVLASQLADMGEVSFPGDCHWFARLPAPRSSASVRDNEKWWTVTSERDADNAASEMIVSLVRFGLPALEEVNSTEKLLKFWSSGRCQGNTEKQRLKFIAVLTGQWENQTVPMDAKLAAHYQAVKLHPQDAQVHLELGIALYANAQLDEAVMHMEEAAKIEQGDGRIHLHLGKAYGLPQARKAITEFRKSLAIDPTNADTHFELAAALANVSDTEGAIGEYREALRLNPLHRQAHFGLVNCLLVLGRDAEASTIHREFIEMYGYG